MRSELLGSCKATARNPILWLLPCVPAVFAGHKLALDACAVLFVWSVLAIVPLAALLSQSSESVAAKTGDTVWGVAERGVADGQADISTGSRSAGRTK
jgi:Ca2+/H+ antiporter